MWLVPVMMSCSVLAWVARVARVVAREAGFATLCLHFSSCYSDQKLHRLSPGQNCGGLTVGGSQSVQQEK